MVRRGPIRSVIHWFLVITRKIQIIIKYWENLRPTHHFIYKYQRTHRSSVFHLQIYSFQQPILIISNKLSIYEISLKQLTFYFVIWCFSLKAKLFLNKQGFTFPISIVEGDLEGPIREQYLRQWHLFFFFTQKNMPAGVVASLKIQGVF